MNVILNETFEPWLLTDMRMLSRFSNVGSCGMSFCTTLLNASNMEWS